VDPLERRDIDARIAHSMLAECAMAGQRMAPAKEDHAGLCIGAEEAVQHGRHDERHAHRQQVLRIREDAAQAPRP